MKRGYSKTFAVFAIVFILLALIIPLVSADWYTDLKNSPALSSIFSDLGTLSSTTVAQILLFFLLALVIYAIADELPFLGGKGWLGGFVAIIIAALATFFLPQGAKEWVNAVLFTYSAMGIAITAIIPFAIIALFSKRLYDKGQPSIISKLLWIIFLVILVVRFVTATTEIGTIQKWAFWIIASLAALMLIWERRIWFYMAKQGIKDSREIAQSESLATVTAELEQISAQILAAPSDAVKNPLIQKYNRLVKYQNEKGGTYHEWGK